MLFEVTTHLLPATAPALCRAFLRRQLLQPPSDAVVQSTLAATAMLVEPSPATHAILRPLKAGETVYQTLFVTKRAFFTLNSLSDSVSDTFCTKNNV